MSIIGVIDVPAPSQAMNCVFHVSGWETHAGNELPTIEIRIDDRPVATIIERFPRPDVAAAHRDLAPTNPRPGFCAAINTTRFPNGAHVLSLMASPGGQEQLLAQIPIEIHNTAETAFFQRAETGLFSDARRRGKLELLLDLLTCLRCRSRLTHEITHLSCPQCAAQYALRDSVPIMVFEAPAYPVDAAELDSPASNNPYPPPLWDLLEETFSRGGIALDLGSGRRTFGADQLVQLEICSYPFTDVVSQSEELPFRDGAFDLVFSRAVTEHVKRPWVLATEMQRVLKPGGTLLVDSAFLQPLHGYPSHYFNMTHFALRELFAGLEVISLRPEPHQHPWFSLSWILDRMLADLSPANKTALADTTIGQFLKEMQDYCRRTKQYYLPEDKMGPPPGALSSIKLSPKRVEELAAGFTLVGRKPHPGSSPLH